MLREQLDNATEANEQLNVEVQKLTGDIEKLKEELEARDEEEHAYFANEHNRLMALWQTVSTFRRQFGDMKSATQRYVKMTSYYLRITKYNLVLTVSANKPYPHYLTYFEIKRC